MAKRFDDMISSSARLATLAPLVPGEAIAFSDLKRESGLADGNLHVQTGKLAAAGYVEIRKALRGRRQVTEYRITELGFERFRLFVRQLEAILDSEAGIIQPVLAADRKDDSEVWS